MPLCSRPSLRTRCRRRGGKGTFGLDGAEKRVDGETGARGARETTGQILDRGQIVGRSIARARAEQWGRFEAHAATQRKSARGAGTRSGRSGVLTAAARERFVAAAIL